MTAEGMTSISVSYEVRRQLNTMRTLSGYKSVNEFLNDLIRAHKITKMNGEIETLRERMKAVADVDVEHLVDRLNLSQNTSEGQLLDAANAGYIELFAKSKSWNAVLWLIMNTIVEDGKPLYSGAELGKLKAALPIVWK